MSGPHETERDERSVKGQVGQARRRRRWPWVAGGVALFLLVGFALLPSVLSLGPGRKFVLGLVNRRMPGSLAVDSWSLGWFSGLEFVGIQVRDAKGSPVLKADAVRVPATIPMLLGRQKELGAVDVESPLLELIRAQDGTWNAASVIPPGGDRLPFDLKGRFKIHSGTVSVRQGEGPAFAAGRIEGEIDIESLNAPVSWSFEAALGQRGSPVKVSGSARIAEDFQVKPESTQIAAELELQGMDLAEVMPLVRGLGSPVDLDGRLSGKMTVQADAKSGATASGRFEVESLRFWGGPLGEDRPEFERVAVEFEGGLVGGHLDVRLFDLDSPMATADLKAAVPLRLLAGLSGLDVQANVLVDIAALSARMPHLLRLQEGLRIREGTCTVRAGVSGAKDGVRADVSGRLEGLVADLGGRELAAAPIVFELKGGLDEQGPRLETLKLDSAFARAEGSGTLESFSLDLAADLSALRREASKFVDLGSADLAGSATARVSVAEAGADLPGGRRLDAAMEIKGLRVAGLRTGSVDLEHLRVQLNALAAFDGSTSATELREVRLEAEGDPGALHLAADRAVPDSRLETVELSGLQLETQVSLAKLVALCHGAGLLPARLTLGGEVRVTAAGRLAGGALDLSSFEGEAQDVLVALGERNLRQSLLRASGALSARLPDRKVSLRDARIEAEPGSVQIGSLEVQDWSRLPGGVEGDVAFDLDLARLLQAARAIVAAPQGLEGTGQLKFAAKIAPPREAETSASRLITGSGRMTDWRIVKPGAELLSGDSLDAEFAVTATPQAVGLPMRLEDLSLSLREGSTGLQVAVAARRMGGLPAIDGMEVDELQIDARGPLNRSFRVARLLGAAPPDLDLQGDAQVDCLASLEGGVVEVERLEAVAHNLLIERAKKSVREPEFRLKASGEVRPARRSLTMRDLAVEASPGTLRAPTIEVTDWALLPEGVSGTLQGVCDLAELAASMRQLTALPAEARVAGRLELDGSFTSDAGAEHGEIRATVAGLKVGGTGSWQFSEDRLELSGKANLDRKRQVAEAESFRLSSSSGLLDFSAKGRLTEWAGARKLSVQGVIAPDFDRIGQLVRSWTGKDLELKGKQERFFSIATEFGHGDWQTILDRTNVQAGLHVGHLRQMGIEARDLALHVSTEQAGIRFALSGTANGGPIAFRPVLSVAGGRPALLLADTDSLVLRDLQITDEMASALVGRVVPLFRNSVTARGLISLDLKELCVPLDRSAARQATAKGSLVFQEVSIGSSALLKELLGILKLGQNAIAVPDQTVGLALRAGRFEQERMAFQVGRYELRASGSVGLDKTLSMLAELPVTREIAGSESTYELLKDQSVKVQIGGTLDKPQIDSGTVRENLRGLVRGAALNFLRRSLE